MWSDNAPAMVPHSKLVVYTIYTAQAFQKLLEAADTQHRAVQSSHSIPVGNSPTTQHSLLKGAPFM